MFIFVVRRTAGMSRMLMQLQEVDVYDDWMAADIFEDFDMDVAGDASSDIAVFGDLSEVCCAVWPIHAMAACLSSIALSKGSMITMHPSSNYSQVR